MGLGLAAVKWPPLAEVHSLPLYEGVVTCILTAMSLLALLGLRYPVRLLPVLLLEVAWKISWLTLVALPRAVGDDIDPATADVVVNCSLVVDIIVVTPWRYAWLQYASAMAGRWR